MKINIFENQNKLVCDDVYYEAIEDNSNESMSCFLCDLNSICLTSEELLMCMSKDRKDKRTIVWKKMTNNEK